MKLIFIFLFTASVCNLSASENWNRFRGINGEGRFKKINLPVTWTSRDYTCEIKLPGVGHSSPVIWGNKLFTTCASTSGATQYVSSIDCKTGQVLWQKEFNSVP